ncbi:hypothetical protein ElyMa_004286600 [Elysia marginata]|uniref:Uncharacterized protein n=1 Tax=Elysia marginata TaxID=1093978 RepID=A0AAV4GXQ5_9GAST|nr:hypothetical protein ElyMa_004286600 [Elysia marginata]
MDAMDITLDHINESVGYLESEMRALHILQSRGFDLEEELKSLSKLSDGVRSELERSFRVFKKHIKTPDDDKTFISQNTQRFVQMENRMMRWTYLRDLMSDCLFFTICLFSLP